MKLKIFFLLVYFVFLLLVVEAFFRLIDYDFSRQLRLYVKIPIYWRIPKDPVGEVYFKRNGPDRWSGRILHQFATELCNDPELYKDEKFVRVTYDKDGFRNPDDLKDWKIALIGDSFMESGFLPYESLVPARLGNLLNVSVKNLGVSYTGTLTHICYLKNYGASQNTRHAVLAFFEGNDVDELEEERQALEYFHQTGIRPYREIRDFKQTSFLKSIKILVTDLLFRKKKAPKKVNDKAYFISGDQRIPITTSEPPKESDSSELQLLDSALAQWADVSREKNLTPWLLYIPTKYRVLDGYMEFPDKNNNADINLASFSLPQQVKTICEKYQIRYLDVTDTLKRETEKGILTYNTMYDAHLNDHGLEVVAAKLADFMKPVIQIQD